MYLTGYIFGCGSMVLLGALRHSLLQFKLLDLLFGVLWAQQLISG